MRLIALGFATIVTLSACGSDGGDVASNTGGTGGTSSGGTSSGGTSSGGTSSGGTSSGGTSSGGTSSGGTSSGGTSSGGGAGTSSGGSAGASGSSGWTDLCTAPPGNLIAHGTFEEGMNGLAPSGWEVRAPGMPDTCKSSGQPSEHVFLATGPTGCGGNALAVDAKGQWDCYAVQRVSDYNSIEGGATYRISASVRAVGNNVNPAAWFVLGVQWLDGNDAFFGDEKNPKTASAAENDYDWKVLQWELVAPANAKRILVWVSAHYPGRVDFDNISVSKL
jgi:hypothetical protein